MTPICIPLNYMQAPYPLETVASSDVRVLGAILKKAYALATNVCGTVDETFLMRTDMPTAIEAISPIRPSQVGCNQSEYTE